MSNRRKWISAKYVELWSNFCPSGRNCSPFCTITSIYKPVFQYACTGKRVYGASTPCHLWRKSIAIIALWLDKVLCLYAVAVGWYIDIWFRTSRLGFDFHFHPRGNGLHSVRSRRPCSIHSRIALATDGGREYSSPAPPAVLNMHCFVLHLFEQLQYSPTYWIPPLLNIPTYWIPKSSTDLVPCQKQSNLKSVFNSTYWIPKSVDLFSSHS